MIIQAPIFDIEGKIIFSSDEMTRNVLLNRAGLEDYRGMFYFDSKMSKTYREWKKENKETGITQRLYAEKQGMTVSIFSRTVRKEIEAELRKINNALQEQFEKYSLENKDEIFKIQLGLYKKTKREKTKRRLGEFFGKKYRLGFYYTDRTKDGVYIDFYEKISGLKYPKDYDKVMGIGKFFKEW